MLFFGENKKCCRQIFQKKNDIKNAKINNLTLQFFTRNIGNINKNIYIDFSC